MNIPILIVIHKSIKRCCLVTMIKLNPLHLILGHILVVESHIFGIFITCIESISPDSVLIFCSDQLIAFKSGNPVQLRTYFQKCRISSFCLVIRICNNVSDFKFHFAHDLISHIIRVL
ncbi:hypothetical protein D3C76_1216170 [compost metagenome]